MKQKLKFLGNIILLAIFDVAILMNLKQIYEKGLQMSVLENIILLVTIVAAGIVVLQDTLAAGRKIVFDIRCKRIQAEDIADYEDDEWLDMEEE